VYLPIHPHCGKAVRAIEFRALIVSPDVLINGRYILLDIKIYLIPIHRREGVSEPHTLRSDSSRITCELSEKPSSEVVRFRIQLTQAGMPSAAFAIWMSAELFGIPRCSTLPRSILLADGHTATLLPPPLPLTGGIQYSTWFDLCA
jgi:hypothetical protein